MICPPAVGEPPEAGRHGGFWMELRGGAGELTFFRSVPDPTRSSVEIHSPDGVIRREFGPPEDTTFEVLVPDDPDATTLVLMGEAEMPPTRAGRRRAQAPVGAQELARFDLASGGDPSQRPGQPS